MQSAPLPSVYPDPPKIDPTEKQHSMHTRFRVVVMQPNLESASALALELSEFVSCDVEMFSSYVDDTEQRVLGEIVIGRMPYHVDLQTPAVVAPPAKKLILPE